MKLKTHKIEIKLTVDILQESKNRYVAWVNEIPHVIVQGKSEGEVKQELLKILKIKFILDPKISEKLIIEIE